MLFADTFIILLISLSLILAFVGFWVISPVLWPQRVKATAAVIEGSLCKTFFIGLIPFVLGLLFLIGGANALGPAGLLLLIAAGIFFLYCQVGVAGIVRLIGEKTAEGDEPAWVLQRRGGILLVLTYLFPLVGWVGVILITAIIGCGAMVRTGLFRTKEPKAAAPAESHEPA